MGLDPRRTPHAEDGQTVKGERLNVRGKGTAAPPDSPPLPSPPHDGLPPDSPSLPAPKGTAAPRTPRPFPPRPGLPHGDRTRTVRSIRTVRLRLRNKQHCISQSAHAMLLLGGRANTIRRCLQSECGKHVPHRRPTQEQRKREPSASASVGEQEGGDEPGRGRRWSAPAHRLIAHAPARLTRRLRRFLLCGQGLQETASTACPLRPAERPVVLVWHLLPVEGPPCIMPGLP